MSARVTATFGLSGTQTGVVPPKQAKARTWQTTHAADPRRQVLVKHGLDVGQVRRTQHGDEEHRLLADARERVDDVDPVPTEVDEGLLACAVACSGFTHRR